MRQVEKGKPVALCAWVTMLIAGAMAMCFRLTPAFAAERTWTRSEILAIADGEAKRLGYDIEKMSVSIGPSREQGGGMPDVEAKLKGRDYWAVYYASLKVQLGGDLWVFIDRQTGEVIESIQGE